MIRATFETDHGPIVFVGIVEENIKRLRAGMPLAIGLKELTPPGQRIVAVYVNLGETHMHTVDEMAAGGFNVPPELREAARQLDEQLARERSE